jgi:hypothetical protein
MPSPQDYSQNAEQFHNEGGMPSALGHGVRGGEPTTERERQATGYAVAGDGSGAGQVKQSDSVDADEQLETFAEGDVARAVAKKAGTQRYQYQNDENDTSQSGDLQLESLHGRGRGEVSLEANEADLERWVFLISFRDIVRSLIESEKC